MPIEIRELIIKATLSDPHDFRGEPKPLSEGETYPVANTVDQALHEPLDPDTRLRQRVAAQLERLLPEYVERFLSSDPHHRLSEQMLTDQIVQILARMKER